MDNAFLHSAELEAKLVTLPTSPGVYKFKDQAGTVIYVGKAKSLRARVRQYARGGDGRAQIRFLLAQLTDVEVIVTKSEKKPCCSKTPSSNNSNLGIISVSRTTVLTGT